MARMFWKLFFGTLLIVVFGAFASWWFAKKNQKVPPTQPNEPLQLLGKMPVGRGMVYYVRLKEHRVIAAVDNTGFRSLTQIKLNPDLVSEAVPPQAPYIPQPVPSFLEVLNQQNPSS